MSVTSDDIRRALGGRRLSLPELLAALRAGGDGEVSQASVEAILGNDHSFRRTRVGGRTCYRDQMQRSDRVEKGLLVEVEGTPMFSLRSGLSDDNLTRLFAKLADTLSVRIEFSMDRGEESIRAAKAAISASIGASLVSRSRMISLRN